MSAPLARAPRRPARRGWCPGVRRPMETGDGLLVRVHPPGGVLTAGDCRLVADCATAFGNGLLDVTARGNLQIRGVARGSWPALLVRLDAAGLVEPDAEGPSRLTLLSPLAGLDADERFDSRALAAALDAAAAGLEGLPDKAFVAVDGGGLVPLDHAGADLHLVALNDGRVAFGLLVASGSADGDESSGSVGRATGLPAPLAWIGAAPLADAPAAAARLLAAYAAMRRSGRTQARRIKGLADDLRAELAAAARLAPAPPPTCRPAAPRAGVIPLSPGRAALLAAPPFGRCDAAQLRLAADWADQNGAGEIRPSLTRGLLIPGLAAEAAHALAGEAAAAGFVVDPADPRLRASACPGAPSCAAAATPAPRDAAALAQAARALLAGGASLHVSACPKGCAHPAPASLTLVGGEDGRYGVVLDGPAGAEPVARLTVSEIMTRLTHATTLDAAFREDLR